MRKLTSNKPRTMVVVLSSLLLFGCASKPREVTASLPLVEAAEVQLGESIPQQYWSELNNPNQTSLTHNDYNIRLSSPYSSGLGYQCRVLEVETISEGKRNRIACASISKNADGSETKSWYLAPSIVEAATVIKIQ
ncbi:MULTISPECIES: hypothetical protein [unclassified Vibrio]|uniref:hypothetical protein n=1 Tax=unclassified Vibrio TaxID=2614977 RepID=UPI00354FD0E1